MERVSNNNAVRVLQIGMHDKIGGIETFLMSYYRNIDRDKIQFDFINPYNSLCFEDEIKEMGGKIYNVPFFKRKPIQYYFSLKKIIKNNQYQIVHVNMLSAANIIPLLAAKMAGVKTIIAHSHNNEIPKSFIKKILNKINKKIMFNCSNVYFACSKNAGDWMFEGKKEYRIIRNAIDFKRFEFNSEERKKQRILLNLDDKFVIGNIGRFAEQKNHMFIIDIFNEIHKKNENARLVLVGDGEIKSKIIEKIKKYNLEDSVILYGTTRKVEDVLQAFDVFLLPSKFEGLGIVLLEAQSSGLKCITSKYVVPNEVDISNQIEFVDLSMPAQMWADIILNIKPNNNRKNVYSELYDIKKQSLELEKIYLSMLVK